MARSLPSRILSRPLTSTRVLWAFEMGSRNNLRGPGFFDLDLGLGKTFPIYAEKVNLKFRVDAFNALNHPNFQAPSFENNMSLVAPPRRVRRHSGHSDSQRQRSGGPCAAGRAAAGVLTTCGIAARTTSTEGVPVGTPSVLVTIRDFGRAYWGSAEPHRFPGDAANTGDGHVAAREHQDDGETCTFRRSNRVS